MPFSRPRPFQPAGFALLRSKVILPSPFQPEPAWSPPQLPACANVGRTVPRRGCVVLPHTWNLSLAFPFDPNSLPKWFLFSRCLGRSKTQAIAPFRPEGTSVPLRRVCANGPFSSRLQTHADAKHCNKMAIYLAHSLLFSHDATTHVISSITQAQLCYHEHT